MVDTIFRAAAILLVILVTSGFVFGAFQLVAWLGAPWVWPNDLVAIAVQPFDVSRAGQVEKEEGRYLAEYFVKHLQRIQGTMSADLSAFKLDDEVRIESILPKSLRLEPDIPLKIDVEVKAFDVDVIGIVERCTNSSTVPTGSRRRSGPTARSSSSAPSAPRTSSGPPVPGGSKASRHKAHSSRTSPIPTRWISTGRRSAASRSSMPRRSQG